MLLAIKNKLSYALLLFAAIGFNLSCGIYSFTGASIPPTMETVSVDFFENNAPLVVSYLRSEEHTSELQSLMRISYAVFCLKKKNHTFKNIPTILSHIKSSNAHFSQ